MKTGFLRVAPLALVVPLCQAGGAAAQTPAVPAPSSAVASTASDPTACSSPFLDTKGLAAPCAQLRQIGTGFNFTEGPVVDQEGNVFFTDQPNNRIHRWDAQTGEITTFLEETGRANGMTMDANGFLIAASDMYGEIWSIDPKTGAHTVILGSYEGKRLNGPNDIWIAPDGGMFITDPLVPRTWWEADDPRGTTSDVGGGFIYHLSPDRMTLTRVAGMEKDQTDLRGNLRVQPNGVVGSPDGRTLYVGYIFPREIWAYDIQPDGELSNPRKFADSHSDGMTIDEEGNIYVTNRESGVTAFSPEGERVFNVPTGRFWTGNVTFAGPDRKTLFVTAADQVFTLEMRVGGVR